MTYADQEQFAAIEKTCDEVRAENVELNAIIGEMRHTLELVYKANCLGKTKQIADLIYPYFSK